MSTLVVAAVMLTGTFAGKHDFEVFPLKILTAALEEKAADTIARADAQTARVKATLERIRQKQAESAPLLEALREQVAAEKAARRRKDD